MIAAGDIEIILYSFMDITHYKAEDYFFPHLRM